MRSTLIRTIAVLITTVMAAVAGCKASPTTPSAPIPEVLTARVVERDVPQYAESIGTTEGFINAQILPKISGYLLKQDYGDGAHVQAGQLLFEIDPRQYQAALDEALGNLAQQEANLKQNQQDLARYTQLYRAGVIPKQTFDTSTQTTRATSAQVQAAKAAVANAKLNLQWTKVYSPIQGVAGIARAQVGDLVSATTLLTTVSRLDPIKVAFPISEQEYLRFAGRINARVNGRSATPVSFELILSNGSVYDHPGEFYAANRQVDVQTGTIEIQATFPNPEDILRPGMYAKIRVQTGVQHDALLVPQSAVNEIQGHYQVAVIGNDKKVSFRSVKPGKKVGDLWLINQGLNPGEWVVTEGVQKIKDGMEVKAVAAPEPSPAISPQARPTNSSQALAE